MCNSIFYMLNSFPASYRANDLSIHYTQLLAAAQNIHRFLKGSALKANCSEDFSPQDGLRDAKIWDVWQTEGKSSITIFFKNNAPH